MWRGNGASVVLALPSSHICAQILGSKGSKDFHPLYLGNVFTDYEGSYVEVLSCIFSKNLVSLHFHWGQPQLSHYQPHRSFCYAERSRILLYTSTGSQNTPIALTK